MSTRVRKVHSTYAPRALRRRVREAAALLDLPERQRLAARNRARFLELLSVPGVETELIASIERRNGFVRYRLVLY
jgi:hypothetical protein